MVYKTKNSSFSRGVSIYKEFRKIIFSLSFPFQLLSLQGYHCYLQEHLLERFDSYVETDPYLAYKSYINSVYYDMTGILGYNGSISFATIFIISLMITLFYLFTNLKSNSGAKTVAPTAYVSGGVPIINQQEDLFLNKIVTQHHIQRNSGGGGGGRGGSHTSSGGHSHGGGGGRR